MPRLAKLRSKNGYWYTAAGGGQYFGRVSVVSRPAAEQAFYEYLKKQSSPWHSGEEALSVASLCKAYLDWVRKFRSERTRDERKRHLEFFCNFQVGGTKLGELSATDIRASDLEALVDFLKEGNSERKAVDPFTADKYATSVKAAFTWGTKHPSPTPMLPGNFRPFSSIEKYKRPTDAVVEADLLTIEEIDALLKFADADLASIRVNGRIRRRQPEEYRRGDANPYKGFEDVLRVYHATGARTSELASAKVRDYVRTTRQIVLRHHKRDKTMKESVSRRITVNDEVAAILARWCEGKRLDDSIFTDPKGRPWNRYTLDDRFKKVRQRAGVRPEMTIYSFRHLWISDMLMAGVDVATVARMAGTSIAMIEKVYGHFRTGHLQKAQAQLDAERQRRRDEAAAETPAA